MSRSARCALVAVTMQCIGCAAEPVDAGSIEPRETLRSRSVTSLGEGLAVSDDRMPSRVSALRPTPRSEPTTPDSKASPYLATESAFIDRNGVSSEMTDPLLESRDLFTKAFERMSEDEKKSMDAQDLANHYRSALERAVGNQGIVEGLTCGLSLCMGLVSARSRADHDAWEDRLYEDSSAERHVILQAVEMNGDRLQNRFLFSTDSAIKAIVLPPRRDR